MIKHIIEISGAEIEIKDDGTIFISSPDKQSIEKARKFINDICAEPVMNQIYEGTVTRIEPFGAFVKFMSGTKDGLVHISQLHTSRINRVEDIVKIGDIVKVKFIGLDRGKIKVSMKGVDGNPTPKPGSAQTQSSYKKYDNRDSRDNRHNRYDKKKY